MVSKSTHRKMAYFMRDTPPLESMDDSVLVHQIIQYVETAPERTVNPVDLVDLVRGEGWLPASFIADHNEQLRRDLRDKENLADRLFKSNQTKDGIIETASKDAADLNMKIDNLNKEIVARDRLIVKRDRELGSRREEVEELLDKVNGLTSKAEAYDELAESVKAMNAENKKLRKELGLEPGQVIIPPPVTSEAGSDADSFIRDYYDEEPEPEPKVKRSFWKWLLEL